MYGIARYSHWRLYLCLVQGLSTLTCQNYICPWMSCQTVRRIPCQYTRQRFCQQMSASSCVSNYVYATVFAVRICGSAFDMSNPAVPRAQSDMLPSLRPSLLATMGSPSHLQPTKVGVPLFHLWVLVQLNVWYGEKHYGFWLLVNRWIQIERTAYAWVVWLCPF